VLKDVGYTRGILRHGLESHGKGVFPVRPLNVDAARAGLFVDKLKIKGVNADKLHLFKNRKAVCVFALGKPGPLAGKIHDTSNWKKAKEDLKKPLFLRILQSTQKMPEYAKSARRMCRPQAHFSEEKEGRQP
jgi:hypothetical protein